MLIGSHFIANQKPNQCPIIGLTELFAANNLFLWIYPFFLFANYPWADFNFYKFDYLVLFYEWFLCKYLTSELLTTFCLCRVFFDLEGGIYVVWSPGLHDTALGWVAACLSKRGTCLMSVFCESETSVMLNCLSNQPVSIKCLKLWSA